MLRIRRSAPRTFALPLLACALLAASSSACVVGRREITLEPPAPSASAAATRGTIVIASVEDRRAFENKPRSPSTPSVSGDVDSMSAEQRKKMVGRQRGGYGNAMGDVALAGEDDVEAQVRRLVTAALVARGYTVTEGGSGARRVEVVIDRFWSWMTPLFAAVRYDANVACTLRITADGSDRSVSVDGKGTNVGQVASNANYELTYTRAYEAFLANLDAALGQAGL